MGCDLFLSLGFLLENKSATITETTVTTVLQRTRTTLCFGILRGPSGGGVEPAGAHKRGGRSWSEEEHLPTWTSHLAGAFVLLERSSCWSVRLAGALVSGSLSGRSWSTSSLSSSPRPRARAMPVPAETARVPTGVRVWLASHRTDQLEHRTRRTGPR